MSDLPTTPTREVARYLTRCDAVLKLLEDLRFRGKLDVAPEIVEALHELEKTRSAWPECEIGHATFFADGEQAQQQPWRAPVRLSFGVPTDRPFLLRAIEVVTSTPAKVGVIAPGEFKRFAEGGNRIDGCWLVVQPRGCPTVEIQAAEKGRECVLLDRRIHAFGYVLSGD